MALPILGLYAGCDLSIRAKYMGVTSFHFVTNAINDVIQRERFVFVCHLGMKHHLKQ